MTSIARWLACATATAMLVACVPHERASDLDANRWSDARQMVLVTIPDWDADNGHLHRYERSGDAWREVGATQAVTIGYAGAAWGIGLNAARSDGPIKREGDGRSPAGVFAIGDAFGYAEHADTTLRYRAMHDSDYCVDVSDSPLYNRIVDARVVGADAIAGSTEPMRRDLHAGGDERYRLGFVIEHNTRAQARGGSCIFAHLWKAPGHATAGCTAMNDATMQSLLTWLRAEQHPVFVLLPDAEYRKLEHAWHLPRLENTR